MILALYSVFTLILGGGLFSFEAVGDVASEIIKDKDRAKQVVEYTEQADDVYKSFTENIDDLSKEFVELNRGYMVTRAEMDALSAKAKGTRTSFLIQYVDLRFKIKDQMTAAEWQAMQAKLEELD